VSELRVVAGVLRRDNKVLAARRPLHKREGGLWEFPGGKVDPGETDAEALVRELREELGVTVSVGAHVADSVFAYAHGTVRLVALACGTDEEPVALDHAELRWLGLDELDSVEWAPADVPVVAVLGR
jgi:8-oxo-dGTP diphosphatase